MEESKYLKLARIAREEGNSENAKKYYELAYEDMPDNPEVKYFASYYALLDSKNIEAESRYLNLCSALIPTLKLAAGIEDETERTSLVTAIIKTFTPLYSSVLLAVLKVSDLANVRTFENTAFNFIMELGEQVIALFGEKEPFTGLVVAMWEDLVDEIKLTMDSTDAIYKRPRIVKIGERIQQYNPDYVIPQEALKKASGCTVG